MLIDVFYKQLNPITIFLCVCVYNNKSMAISISMCERMKLMYVSSEMSSQMVLLQCRAHVLVQTYVTWQ